MKFSYEIYETTFAIVHVNICSPDDQLIFGRITGGFVFLPREKGEKTVRKSIAAQIRSRSRRRGHRRPTTRRRREKIDRRKIWRWNEKFFLSVRIRISFRIELRFLFGVRRGVKFSWKVELGVELRVFDAKNRFVTKTKTEKVFSSSMETRICYAFVFLSMALTFFLCLWKLFVSGKSFAKDSIDKFRWTSSEEKSSRRGRHKSIMQRLEFLSDVIKRTHAQT